ncbi:MAG: EF-hand domain-containing protein [Acutalibacteraceae bacterium]|nr:EF-hand domain-containing protein [Acutalibacteraceae bacterium]
MKNIIICLLGLSLGAVSAVQYHNYQEEKQYQNQLEEIYAKYDTNQDGVISDEEQEILLADIGKDSEFTEDEVRDAVNQAKDILCPYDTNTDGQLSQDEKMGLVHDVYAAYDNGEIPDGLFKDFLAGYEAYVNRLNGLYDLLDEVGVGGPSYHIELRD